MAGGIKKTDIVEADLTKLSEDLRKVGESISFIITESAKVKPISGLSDLAKITKETAENARNLAIQQKAVLDIETKVVSLMEKEAKARTAEANEAIKNSQAKTQAIINEEKAIQSKIKTDKELLSLEKMQEQQLARNAKSVKSMEGYYNQLNASLNDNIIKYKNLTKAQLDDVNISGTLIKTIQAQDAELKQLDATMGRNQRNVGNYKSGFNGLNFSIMQIGRELPSLAYGVNVLAGAISNNIPMAVDEVNKARKELAALRAEGKEGVPIWKQLAGAIFSWQTALVVGLTIFTMYGKEIVGFIGRLFKTTEAINNAKLAQEAYNKVRLEGISSAQSELTRLNLLWAAYKNVNISQADKLKIQNELQSKYPAYFKNLGDETFNVGQAEKGYYQLKNAILEAANARVFADDIAKTKGEIITDLEPKLQKANDAITKFIDEHKISLAAELTSGFKGVAISNIRLESLKKESKLIEQEILQRNAKIFKLNNEINPVALLQDYGAQDLKNQLKNDKDQAKSEKDKAKKIEDILKDFNDIKYRMAVNDKEEQIDIEKDLQEALNNARKQAIAEQKAFTDEIISNSVAQADEEKLSAQETTIEKIKAAKNNKDEIQKIQHELTMFMIDEDIKAQQRILDTYGLEADAYKSASERIRRLRLQRGEEDIQFTQQTEEQKKAVISETMQATNALLQQGLSFAQQIYSQQAERAQETYDTEMKAAGDSLEYQTLAKRKFEAEDKKIKQRQAIASKLQAVLDAGLALALAIATTWKNPLLAALNIGAATIGLGMALATPIPQFADGDDNTPSTFIAGEEGSELIRTKSGKMILTPNKATLFSDNNLIGSTVFPHDQTQQMLANMAFNQVREVVDLSKTNEHLASMDKQMKNKVERSIDAKGRTVIRRGSLVSTL